MGSRVGLITLEWPRTQAVILDARVDIRETTSTVPGTDKYRGGRTETREAASFHVRYRYRVDGQDYEADGVEPGDLGLQTRPPRASRAAPTRRGRRWRSPTTRAIRPARTCCPAPARRPRCWRWWAALAWLGFGRPALSTANGCPVGSGI